MIVTIQNLKEIVGKVFPDTDFNLIGKSNKTVKHTFTIYLLLKYAYRIFMTTNVSYIDFFNNTEYGVGNSFFISEPRFYKKYKYNNQIIIDGPTRPVENKVDLKLIFKEPNPDVILMCPTLINKTSPDFYDFLVFNSIFNFLASSITSKFLINNSSLPQQIRTKFNELVNNIVNNPEAYIQSSYFVSRKYLDPKLYENIFIKTLSYEEIYNTISSYIVLYLAPAFITSLSNKKYCEVDVIEDVAIDIQDFMRQKTDSINSLLLLRLLIKEPTNQLRFVIESLKYVLKDFSSKVYSQRLFTEDIYVDTTALQDNINSVTYPSTPNEEYIRGIFKYLLVSKIDIENLNCKYDINLNEIVALLLTMIDNCVNNTNFDSLIPYFQNIPNEKPVLTSDKIKVYFISVFDEFVEFLKNLIIYKFVYV